MTSSLERTFALMWLAAHGPALEREHRFFPGRRWRFDFAHPGSLVAIELEGGVWTGGRHTRGAGFIADAEKYNEAAFLGWRVFRLPGDLLNIPTVERIVALTAAPKPIGGR